jgi:site-specific DNA-methyltransferase (adenine-specific)
MIALTLARKPITGTVARSAQETGCGALNIGACRIPTSENLNGGAYLTDSDRAGRHDGAENWRYKHGGAGEFQQPAGRWPANLILSGKASKILDESTGILSSGNHVNTVRRSLTSYKAGWPASTYCAYGDSGGASRFFKVFGGSSK